MSKTIAVHVLYNSWYISLPSSAKQQREMIIESLCTSQIEASTSPPRATPRVFEFLENFWNISHSPGRKAVQMPHPRENYQITVLTFQ